MSPFQRYLLFQIPGWLGAAAVAALAIHWDVVSLPLGLAGALAWMGKDFVLYPLVRHAYQRDVPTAVERLIGATGRVTRALEPGGWVRVHGALWRAQSADGEPISAGDEVVVRAVRRQTLVVAPLSESAAASPPETPGSSD